MTAHDPVLTVHDVADELGKSYRTVCRYIKAGELKATKRGNSVFIRRSWLEEFLDPTRPANVA